MKKKKQKSRKEALAWLEARIVDDIPTILAGMPDESSVHSDTTTLTDFKKILG